MHRIKDITFHDGKYYVQIDTINKEIFAKKFIWNVIVDGEEKIISDFLISKNMPQNIPDTIVLESKENLSYLIGKSSKTKIYLLKHESKPNINKVSQSDEIKITVKNEKDKSLHGFGTERGKIEERNNYNENKPSINQSFLADDDIPVKKKKKWWLF